MLKKQILFTFTLCLALSSNPINCNDRQIRITKQDVTKQQSYSAFNAFGRILGTTSFGCGWAYTGQQGTSYLMNASNALLFGCFLVALSKDWRKRNNTETYHTIPSVKDYLDKEIDIEMPYTTELLQGAVVGMASLTTRSILITAGEVIGSEKGKNIGEALGGAIVGATIFDAGCKAINYLTKPE